MSNPPKRYKIDWHGLRLKAAERTVETAEEESTYLHLIPPLNFMFETFSIIFKSYVCFNVCISFQL